jgi:hypothetical protein
MVGPCLICRNQNCTNPDHATHRAGSGGQNQLALTWEEQAHRMRTPRPATPFADDLWRRFLATIDAHLEERVAELLARQAPGISEIVLAIIKERK